MARLFIFLISLYRKYISPLKSRPSCRFTPTCSQYAIEALGGEYNEPRDFSADKDFRTIEDASVREGFGYDGLPKS